MFTRKRAEEERAKSRIGSGSGSVLRAGRAGAIHARWIFEAIQELKDEKGVERIGVWLEETAGAGGPDNIPWRGLGAGKSE